MEQQIKEYLLSLADKKTAAQTKKFFKTAKGEYSYGDKFLGIKMEKLRETAKRFSVVEPEVAEKLLQSEFHEIRMFSLILLTNLYKRGDKTTKDKIFDIYLKNTSYINNWDLVDVSAHHIVGTHLFEKDTTVLHKLSKSENMWERRISIVSTLYFIKNNRFGETLSISEILIEDEEDLIHKATGWMLREVGKMDIQAERKFLLKHYNKMPRTMLRYAIERLDENERQGFLKGKF
ncbi:DNA alkylation repair protein [Sulfurovum sp. zt1-1]|uniref:DNA alkylation repair protein n=1 Tax=Sulfurovum zhangzhouensis TaxID=3019067 RepID=A0ABT7QXQ6_9BACT|nr:DNA alkylation repair protein [Sulfurovum zhangzhouensis]MDM5271613.1 DNA alkylation repair protein [Sulfurovum zhangzhouensis]